MKGCGIIEHRQTDQITWGSELDMTSPYPTSCRESQQSHGFKRFVSFKRKKIKIK